eukprot:GHUV01048988.1.p1 GENE.GHUV01048988.1~~GHUV01048988.1.p1  ORF type:complete len:392 (+),score=130.85 GHUV01048988.1:313-1488(+)
MPAAVAATRQYKIYDLSKPDYTLLYTVVATGITEVKLSSSHLVIIRQPYSRIQPPSCSSSWTQQEVPSIAQQLSHQTNADSDGSVGLEGDARVAEYRTGSKVQQVLPVEVISAVNGQVGTSAAVRASINVQLRLGMLPGCSHVCSWPATLGFIAPIGIVYAFSNLQPVCDILACLQVVAKHDLAMQPGQAYFEVLELFGSHLLLKQPVQTFRIIDVVAVKVTGSSSHESLSQVSSFVYLQPQHLFMTVSYHTLITWNFKAEQVASFEDHTLWYPGNLDDPLMCLTGDWVVSYCRPKNMQTSLLAANAVGAIHISNVWTGQLVAKIEAKQTAEEDADMQELLLDTDSGTGLLAIEQAMRKALTDVTCVSFDDLTLTIYTGNQTGMVHHWAPG